jgi:hypothetical protein
LSGRAWSGLLVLALGGCRAFPEIASGECGNRVVEAGEDCDFFARSGSECRPPDSIGACHFDCSPTALGVPRACPPGFGCEENDVCRRSVNAFEAVANPVPGGYRSLESGDFDGDGRADIVALDMRGGKSGLTRVDIHYYDQQGQPSATFNFADSVAGAAIFTQESEGSRQGIVVARDGLGVMLGERDRTLSPAVRPTYFLPLSRMAVIPVSDANIERSTPLVVLADKGGGLDLSVPGIGASLLTKMASYPHTLAELEPPVKGPLLVGDEHPCDDLVLAAVGGREVSIFQFCERESGSSVLRYRDGALVLTLELPGGAVLNAGPQIADVDADGHADLLVSSDGALFVASGDGASLSPLTPFELKEFDFIDGGTELVQPSDLPRPLAAGDFTGDGRADLVDARGLWVSMTIPGATGNVFRKVHENEGADWTEARIADVTADGKPDVIASSTGQTALAVFTGTGTERPNALVVSTTHPAERLTLGDFDSDQAQDVAFIERGAGPAGEDEFLVAFGGSFESLSEPVPGGHVGGVWDLTVLPDSADDLRSDLAILHELTDAEGTTGSAMSVVQSSTHRNFLSPVQLEYVNDEGDVQGAGALTATTGHFRRPSEIDALALAYHDEVRDEVVTWYPELWFLPNLNSRASTVLPLGWGLDSRLVPAVFDETDPESGSVLARLAAGDVTGDGIDEVVIVAPIEDHSRCLIVLAELSGATPLLEALPSVVLDEPCSVAPSFRVADLDADGAADLVLAMGGLDFDGRLVALWNDGHGGFDANDATTVASSETGARAFTVYQSEASGPPRIAYVSEHSAHVLESRGRERAFVEVAEVPNLIAATGIAAGDVNGDGLVDLAVADAGWLRLFRAGVVR